MTDPIKEQAEGLKYLFYGGRCYRIMPEGSTFTAKKSEMLNVSKAIETHLREKEELRAEMEASLIGQEHRLGSKVEMQEQEIKALEAEIERLRNPKDCIIVDRDVFDEMLGKRRARKEKESSIRLDLVNKLQSLEAHNLELTQALKEAHEEVIRRSLRPYSAEEKVKKALSSPASRKYLAMIELCKLVIKARNTQVELPLPIFTKAKEIEALESEEANEGD